MLKEKRYESWFILTEEDDLKIVPIYHPESIDPDAPEDWCGLFQFSNSDLNELTFVCPECGQRHLTYNGEKMDELYGDVLGTGAYTVRTWKNFYEFMTVISGAE